MLGRSEKKPTAEMRELGDSQKREGKVLRVALEFTIEEDAIRVDRGGAKEKRVPCDGSSRREQSRLDLYCLSVS